MSHIEKCIFLKDLYHGFPEMIVFCSKTVIWVNQKGSGRAGSLSPVVVLRPVSWQAESWRTEIKSRVAVQAMHCT